MDKMRERFVAEINRMEEACKTSESKYLRSDYKKAIRKMRMELMEYDSYRNGCRK